MGYTVGVSSGMFKIAQQQQKEQYLTILRKVFWGAQKGVNFTQLDLETITEFNEPYVKDSIAKIKELGLNFGIHGETAATGIHTMVLESALSDEYDRSHDRFIDHIEGGGMLGADYMLTHVSEAMPIKLIGTMALQSTKIVDFWGRDIRDFLDKNKDVLNWAVEQDFMRDIAFGLYMIYDEDYYLKLRLNNFWDANAREPTEDELKKLRNESKEMYKSDLRKNIYDSSKRPSVHYGTERLAYALVAKYMELKNDPLWISMVGKNKVFDEKMYLDFRKWVPAAAAKYIWGHFFPLKKFTEKYSKNKKSYKDPIPILEKYKLIWTFEPEMAQTGWEKYMRLVSIKHIYNLIKAINHPLVKIAIDAEHLLSAGEDPIKNVEGLPHGAGKDVYVVHVGWPTPHIPAHVPIYLGSEAQVYTYEMLYKLKQKGMKDAIIIFERGGGEDPVKTSVIAIRKMIKYLVKNTQPKDLPPDFYGMDPKGHEYARQLVNIKMHAYEPLTGLITQPEEEHGVFGKSAIDKGKGEQWKKEKYR